MKMMIPSEQPVRAIVEALIGLAMLGGIAWPVILATALHDRRVDRPPSCCFGHLQNYLPKQRPEVWWHHLIRLPLYFGCVLFVALVNFLVLPPMLAVELWARLRAKRARRY